MFCVFQLASRQCEILKYVYYGGIEHSLRSQVWLYLLGHYPFQDIPDSDEKVQLIDEDTRHKYSQVLSQWQSAERDYMASKGSQSWAGLLQIVSRVSLSCRLFRCNNVVSLGSPDKSDSVCSTVHSKDQSLSDIREEDEDEDRLSPSNVKTPALSKTANSTANVSFDLPSGDDNPVFDQDYLEQQQFQTHCPPSLSSHSLTSAPSGNFSVCALTETLHICCAIASKKNAFNFSRMFWLLWVWIYIG